MGIKKVIRIDPEYTYTTIDELASESVIHEKTTLTSSFLEKLSHGFNLNSSPFILPKNCRFVKQYNDEVESQRFLFVLEDKPTTRTLRVNLSMESSVERLKTEGKLEEFGYKDFVLKPIGVPYTFRVSFPYIVHVLVLTLTPSLDPTISHSLFYRLSPLKSTFDYLLKSNLPNIDEAQKVCPGSYHIKSTSIPDMIDEYFDHFWSSVFNKDLPSNYLAYQNTEFVSDFLQWQYYSVKDSQFVFNVAWEDVKTDLGERIDQIENEQHLYNPSLRSFETMVNMINSPHLVSKKRTPIVAFTNWIDSIIIDSFCLSIGDKVTLHKKELYIKDFLSVSGIGYIVFEDSNGKTYQVLDSHNLRHKLVRKLKENQCPPSVEIKGETYSVGDIVVLEFQFLGKIHSVIDTIIKDRTGRILFQLANGKRYIVDHIKIQKFDKNKINIHGTSIVTGEKYYFLHGLEHGMMGSCELVVCKQIVHQYDQIYIEFTSPVNLTRVVKRIELTQITKDILLPYTDLSKDITSFTLAYDHLAKLQDGFLYYNDRIYCLNYNQVESASFEEIKQFVTPNEIRFPGTAALNIGDRIVVACWNEPNEMIKRRSITNFIVNDEEKRVLVETTDGESIRQDPIVIGDKILCSSFKHIETEYKNLKAGMVIKPKTVGISCFPRRANYRIIGFIGCNFTKFPLVLMSNCCTLWPFQVEENFNIVPNTNVENPDIVKIKAQQLDMFEELSKFDGTQILLYHINYSGLRLFNLNIYRLRNGVALTTKVKTARVGFLYPRVEESNSYNTWINGFIHGNDNIIFNTNGKFNFKFDKRIFD